MPRRRVRPTPRWVIGAAVAVLLVLSEVTHSGDFFAKATLSTLTPFVGVMLIASLGQAIVIGSGGIDLSIPATMTLVGVITLKVSESRDDRLVWAALRGRRGLRRDRLRQRGDRGAPASQPLRRHTGDRPVVAGIARYIRGPVPQYTRVPPVLVDKARTRHDFGISMTLIIAVAVTLVGAVVLRSTVSGRRLVASSASRSAAALIGLRASSYRIATFVLCSLLAGIAAFMLSGQLGAPDLSLGSPYLLATVVSVVLSGATLSEGRVDLLGVALGTTFITVLNFDLRVHGYSFGVKQLVQAVVLAGGLVAVHVIRTRASWWGRLLARNPPVVPTGTTPVPVIQ